MKTLNDIIIDDQLVIGEECFYNHNKYTYLGKTEEGRYKVSKVTSDSELVKYLDDKPQRPKLPLNIYVKNNRTGKTGEITEIFHMMEKMYYKVHLYDDVFRGYDNETFHDLVNGWELLEESPYLNEEDLLEKLDEINDEMKPFKYEIVKLEEKIKQIKNESIVPIEKRREELYLKCKHDWHKYDEVEISNRYFEQECECRICGKVKFNKYNKF